VNIDRIIEQQRAALLGTTTGQSVACEPRTGQTYTPGELARRRTTQAVRRHGRTSSTHLKDDL